MTIEIHPVCRAEPRAARSPELSANRTYFAHCMIILLTGARQQATQVLSELAAPYKMNICTIATKERRNQRKRARPYLVPEYLEWIYGCLWVYIWG